MEKNECIICFDIINRKEPFIYCDICKVEGHSRCFKKWWKISHRKKRCVVCQQKKCLVEENSRIGFFNCCFYWCINSFTRDDYILLND